jgi:hypothetical protein
MQRAAAVAETFWSLVSARLGDAFDPHHFPRDLQTFVSEALELPVITRPALTLHSADHYLCLLQREPETPDHDEPDRLLDGLLHVGPPCSLILLREGLSEPRRNYVLAHELGHFLADVFTIKSLWLQTLSEQAEAIDQAFSWQATDAWLDLRALLKGLPARPVTITVRGKQLHADTSHREILADLVARELMAPWAVVAPLVEPNDSTTAISLLHERFGLPRRIAAWYESDLRACLTPLSDTLARLFAPLQSSTNR